MRKLLSSFVLFFSSQCLANRTAQVRYVDCVDGHSNALRRALVLPLNQSELTLPGPSACLEQCLNIDRVFSYFLVHVPADKQFVNQLVCACVTKETLQAVASLDDELCNLPCPKGSGHFVDAANLSGIQARERSVEESLLPNSRPRFLALPDLKAERGSYRTGARRMPAHHSTCGDGLGLLSVYETDSSSSRALTTVGLLVLVLIVFFNLM